MLSQLVPVLTLAATLLHSALGCCWHHGHEAIATSGPIQVARPAEGCSHHHHRSDTRQDEPSEEPCDHQDGQCHEPSCVYVVAKHVEMPPAIASDDFATVEDTVLNAATVDASALSLLEMNPPRSPAPEMRALLQVWVI